MFSGRAVEEFAADRRKRVIEREADRSIALGTGEPLVSATGLCLNTASLSRPAGALIITGRLSARQPAVTGRKPPCK